MAQYVAGERQTQNTIAWLKGILRLEEETGKLYWIEPSSNRVKVGDEAGGIRDDGYRRLRVWGERWYVHQIVFLISYGWLPDNIDHIDRNRSNNRPSNLRDGTGGINEINREPYGELGIKGVYRSPKSYRFMARISRNRKDNYLGTFATIEEAKCAVDQWHAMSE